MKQVYEYIDANWQEAVEDLKRFCRQPSISAQGIGMGQAATLTAQLLQEHGIKPQILPTPKGGYPVVYGELRGNSPLTLLFYDHYDVQPPEPLELWSTPPFEPILTEGKLRARGVSDDKGAIVARLFAIKAFRRTNHKLPISIKFLIEGGEEIGSPNLGSFVEENRELLKADASIWEGGGVNWEDRPTITLGLKGILYVELEAHGAARDIHSSMATIIPNPAWRLAWALSSLKDPEENILIEGFYDEVQPPTPEEIESIKAIPSGEEELKKNLDLEGFLKGLTGFDLRSYHLLKPTCTICGLNSGYTGEGSKTVLPCQAKAKLEFRLVPKQSPEDILSKLRRHLDKHGFSDIAISAKEGEKPARTPLDSPFVKLVSKAASEVYGSEPIIILTSTGSGPMFPFTDTLSLPVASSGVGYPDSRAHAPDENIRLSDFILGIKHIAAILDRCKGIPMSATLFEDNRR